MQTEDAICTEAAQRAVFLWRADSPAIMHGGQGPPKCALGSHQDLSRQSTGCGKQNLHLHIYLKLRKDVGFTNIFSGQTNVSYLSVKERNQGRVRVLPAGDKDAGSILQGRLLVKCVYRMYYLNYFNSNTLCNMDMNVTTSVSPTRACWSAGGLLNVVWPPGWKEADACVCTAGPYTVHLEPPQPCVLIGYIQDKTKS